MAHISAAAHLDAALAMIAARDAQIGAFVRLAPDARAAAAASDRSAANGALQGWPIAVKDLIATAGLGTEYGSPIFAGHVPDVDADCVARLKRAGAVIVGKTVTTEFAHLRPGPTRNPHDPARTPGGSSSGSAAAVAAGMARAALGTQTGGSVIRPASYCGVFGFKSSVGRTDMRGVHELARAFDTVGWFATTARDLRTLGGVLLTPPRNLGEGPPRPRIARLRTPFDARGDASAHAVCDAAAQRLAAGGAAIETLSLPTHVARIEALHQRIVAVEAARAFAAYRGRLSAGLEAFLATADEANYEEALADRQALRAEFAALAAPYDALLLPAATGEAPLGLDHTGDSIFSMPLSLLGPACATLPFGEGPHGLPIGVQLVGRAADDEALLALVEWAAERLGL